MSDLLLEYHELIGDFVDSALLENRVANGTKVYVNIHNPYSNQAINFAASSVFSFFEYDEVVHEDFCGILEESTTRSKYHFLSIPAANIVLPDVVYGQHYTVEYWIEAASGVQDRDTDDLLTTERLYWRSNKRAGAFLELSQEESIGLQVWKQLEAVLTLLPLTSAGKILLGIRDHAAEASLDPASARYESFCSVSYDSDTQRLGFCAWLEKEGALQLDAKTASVEVYNSSDALVASAAAASIDASGQFPMEDLGIALSPDENYFVKTTIVDIKDVSRITGGSAIAWD